MIFFAKTKKHNGKIPANSGILLSKPKKHAKFFSFAKILHISCRGKKAKNRGSWRMIQITNTFDMDEKTFETYASPVKQAA